MDLLKLKSPLEARLSYLDNQNIVYRYIVGTHSHQFLKKVLETVLFGIPMDRNPKFLATGWLGPQKW